VPTVVHPFTVWRLGSWLKNRIYFLAVAPHPAGHIRRTVSIGELTQSLVAPSPCLLVKMTIRMLPGWMFRGNIDNSERLAKSIFNPQFSHTEFDSGQICPHYQSVGIQCQLSLVAHLKLKSGVPLGKIVIRARFRLFLFL